MSELSEEQLAWDKEQKTVGTRKIVWRVEDGMDRTTIACTNYEMRNFYRQFGDGFFSTLDVMNYIQHHQVVRWCKKGTQLLDVCCGRGLLLPLLRYYAKDIGSYTGVDIEAGNAIFTHKRVTDGKPVEPDYYPFPVSFVHANAAEMSKHLKRSYDVIVYTSSIEHMHKEMGQQSLHECRKVSRPGTILIVTCPNTPEDQDGFDTQYRAHVYEWKRSELHQGLQEAGFQIITEYGLLMDRKTLKEVAYKKGLLPTIERLEKFIPGEWLVPIFAPLFPEQSKEIAIVAKAV